MMGRQVGHFSRLIDDLMDVSRISTGKIGLRMEAVDLAKAVTRAVEMSRPLIDEKGHRLSVQLPEAPILLDADPTRIERVFDNLLTNAAKYSDPGGFIGPTASREGDSAVVRVRDEGIGISAESPPHIFDLFVQAERRLDGSQGGLGLGLSLVKSLVEMHGGGVSVASEGLGRGKEFVVRLPVRPAALSDGGGGHHNGRRRSDSALPRRRILVVDDNMDSARSMAMVLRRLWGQETEVAHDGIEALEKAGRFAPDVILLDIGLPGISGYEVATRLRENPSARAPPLIAMTGLGQEDDVRQSRESGLDHHLVKPVDLDLLRGLIAALPPRARGANGVSM